MNTKCPHVYLAAPIFTERDRDFNTKLETEILAKCPNMDLYLAQNNKSINDKTGCATSADIYVGDVRRLKQADMLITVMSGDMPPIGSSYECAYYTALCEQDETKQIIALYDDCRDGSHTYSTAKRDAMLTGIAENQWPYINLLAVGFVKRFGKICFTHEEFVQAIIQQYNIITNPLKSGIYKITNLATGLIYIGQTTDLHNQYLKDFNPVEWANTPCPLYEDMKKYGVEYFKYEILEKCDTDKLTERAKYWIEYYDSCDQGYNISEQSTHIFEYDLNGHFIAEYQSIAEAQRTKGLKSNSSIVRAAQYNDNTHESAGSMWRYYKIDLIPPYHQKAATQPVYAYDIKSRLLVAEYDSAIQASNALQGNYNVHLNEVCAGKRKSCMGFIWSNKKFERLPENYWETK